VASLNADLAARGDTLAVTEKERQLIQEQCNTAEEQLVVCQAEVRECLLFKHFKSDITLEDWLEAVKSASSFSEVRR
jgi:hypothetical protein